METAKFWVALLGGVLTAVMGVWPSEWEGMNVLVVVTAAVTAAGVYLVPNTSSNEPGRHEAGPGGPLV